MAKLVCPQCGSELSSPETWAKAALATLMAAPAVQDMATQVRCPTCQQLFTLRQGGQGGSWSGFRPMLFLIAILLAVAILLPGK
mgnify:CR=1 FL=1